jgi:hypothetical protein
MRYPLCRRPERGNRILSHVRLALMSEESPRRPIVDVENPPTTLAEAIDVAARMARLNYLLVIGLVTDLEAGTSVCFEDDLATLREVALGCAPTPARSPEVPRRVGDAPPRVPGPVRRQRGGVPAKARA